jgi:hypothetical protein
MGVSDPSLKLLKAFNLRNVGSGKMASSHNYIVKKLFYLNVLFQIYSSDLKFIKLLNKSYRSHNMVELYKLPNVGPLKSCHKIISEYLSWQI